MDLIPAMQRAGQCLLNWADPQSEALSAGGYEVAHNIGRWFDAVLRLEHTIGFTIPPEHEAKMLRLLQLLTDNPDRMLINRPDLPWMAAFNNVINPHNLRETMLVHHALVRYRNREPDAGRTFCESLNRCFTDAGHFDATQLGAAGSVPFTQDPSHTEPEHPPHNWFDATATTGRALEAVIDFHQATDDPLALHLAQRLAQHHLEHSTNEDGSVRSEIIHPENVGHNHSYHGTLRGLLRFGLLTGQQSYIDTVAATYRVGLPQSVITESGWTPHDLGVTRFPNDDGDPVGETASVGDNAQLALWLARDAGQTHLLDNVERIVRSRILPAQVTEDHLRDNPDVKFGPAHLGGWGAHLPAHAAMGFALDVVAALAHSLCDIHHHIVTHAPDAVTINLHFDYRDDAIKLTATRDQSAQLNITIEQPRDLSIRLPQWTDPASAQLTIDDQPTPINLQGAFIHISADQRRPQSRIVLTHDLPQRLTEETMPVSGRQYKFKWRGDQIVGVLPQDTPAPFYPPMSDNPT